MTGWRHIRAFIQWNAAPGDILNSKVALGENINRPHRHSTRVRDIAWGTVNCDTAYGCCAGTEVDAACDLSDDGVDIETEDCAAAPDYANGVGVVLVRVVSCVCLREIAVVPSRCDADLPPFITLPVRKCRLWIPTAPVRLIRKILLSGRFGTAVSMDPRSILEEKRVRFAHNRDRIE